MAASYYAITRRQSEWVYLCAGTDPTQVYHDAIEILRGRADVYGDEPIALSPAIEYSLDNLRVVPDSVARQTYQVKFGAVVAEE